MKASSLSRSFFRAVLANKPYHSHGCLRIHSRPRYARGSILSTHSLRRSLFGINFGSRSRTLEGAKRTHGNVELAQATLVDLIRSRRARSRLPPSDKVVDAFKFLFAQRSDQQRTYTKNEIFLASEAFKYLQDTNLTAAGDTTSVLSRDDLFHVLANLASSTSQDRYRSDVKTFASNLFVEIGKSGQKDEAQTLSAEEIELQKRTTAAYIQILAKTGSSKEALEIFRKNIDSLDFLIPEIWVPILKGLANEGSIQDMWETFNEMQNLASFLDQHSHEELTTFFANRNEVDNAKKIFDIPLPAGKVPTTACLVSLVELCLRNDQQVWGEDLVKELKTRTDNGDIAPVLLLWATRRNADSLHIRNVIEDLANSGMTNALIMGTMNRLIKFAYEQKNPKAGADYISLAKSLHLRPDASTYAIQLQYQLQQADLSAASETFELLAVEDITADASEVPVLNALVSALAFSENPSHELLMRIVDRILENEADLDPEAVAGLCHDLLRRGDFEEASSVLRYRVDSYPLAERAKIAAIFKTFITDPSIPAQTAFNAYDLFRYAFPETRVEDRLPLMHSFFNRNRPDLGCLVFGHMRQQEDLKARPTVEAYAQCFEGIAKCKDIDGLQMVYNMLKLDLEVEQTTRIHNGLIHAYTACRMPYTAIIDHFWKILDSREGPTLSSFALALRACETWIPQGSQEARQIIALMQSWNLIITKEIYHCYIGAIAGQSEFENTVDLIESMYEDIGDKPDVLTIGTFYNAIPWQYRKDEVEAWAKAAYPQLWEELLTYGDEIDEEWEIRYFKIDRSIDVEDEPLFGQGEYNARLARRSIETLEAPSGRI